MRRALTGCGTALVTPFTADESLDEPAIRRLARRQIDAGIHFLVPCGTTGESPTLTPRERLRVVEIVVEEAAGKVPVLAGAGGNDTREVIEAARDMERAGATGLLSVTPYYNKPTPDGLVRHYTAIAASVSLPIILYNVPGRTGCNIDPATLLRLAAIPNVVGVKEASGNMSQICEICAAVPADFIVLSGDDALTLPAMAVGGKGIISVASNEAPAEMARMVDAASEGDFTTAREVHTRLLPLMQVNFIESNPVPVKAALALMGLAGEHYRSPLAPPRAESRQRIARVLEGLGLLDVIQGARGGRRGAGLSQGRGQITMIESSELEETIDRLYGAGADADRDAARAVFVELRARLSAGALRAAEPDPAAPTGWRVNAWVKRGILLGFRWGDLADASIDHGRVPFFDKDSLPLKRLRIEDGVRLVPGGSAVRDGAFLAPGVICMPPMYVNIGAWVGEGTLIDSHALVGSCAQIGRHVHVSAGAQVGGVLEPVGALPVIVEDEALVGGNTGLYEGVIVKTRAVIGAGAILTGSTPIYDLVRGEIVRTQPDQPLVVPPGAVVVPGARLVTSGPGPGWGLSLVTPVIVKYRDDKTDTRTALEAWIR